LPLLPEVVVVVVVPDELVPEEPDVVVVVVVVEAVPLAAAPKAGRFMRLIPPLEIRVVVARVRMRPSAPDQLTCRSTLARRWVESPSPLTRITQVPLAL